VFTEGLVPVRGFEPRLMAENHPS